MERRGRIHTQNPRARRRGAVLLALVAGFYLALAILSAFASTPFATVLAGFVAVPAVVVALLVYVLADRDPGKVAGRRGTLELDDGEVRLTREGQPAEPLDPERFLRGWVEPHPAGSALVLEELNGRQTRFFAAIDDTAADQAVLRALDLDALAVELPLVADPSLARGCVTLVLVPFVLIIVASLAVALATPILFLLRGDTHTAGALVSGPLIALFCFAIIKALSHFAIPHRVTIGREGLVVRHSLGRREPIAFDDLREVRAGGAHLVLVRKDGRTLELRASDEAAHVAATAIDRARRAYARHDKEHVLAAVTRGEQSLADWREALVRLTSPGAATFRRAAVDREHLLRIAEDPSQAPEARVGSAFALAQSLEAESPAADATHRRLRIAVEGCADDDLSAALEAAADGELDEKLIRRASRDR